MGQERFRQCTWSAWAATTQGVFMAYRLFHVSVVCVIVDVVSASIGVLAWIVRTLAVVGIQGLQNTRMPHVSHVSMVSPDIARGHKHAGIAECHRGVLIKSLKSKEVGLKNWRYIVFTYLVYMSSTCRSCFAHLRFIVSAPAPTRSRDARSTAGAARK